MKALLQLEPKIKIEGVEYSEIVGDFDSNDQDIWAIVPMGVLIFPRSNVQYALCLNDDVDLALFAADPSIKIIE
jgi:hypothetical protein